MSEITRLTDASDKYLAHHPYDPEAKRHVIQIMHDWYAAVTVATEKALEELGTPVDNVYFLPNVWSGIPEQTIPPGA